MRRELAGLAFLLATAMATGPTVGDEVRDFYNVVAPDGADPWVIRGPNGWYYATLTTGRDVTLIRSKTLSGLGGGERRVIYRPPAGVENLWAPEIHEIDGKWYVYVASDDGASANHRMSVLENPSADPFTGAFTLKGKVADLSADRWAIDATVFRTGGRLYMLWSGWEGTEDVEQDLYIAPMRNPWTLSGPRVRIVRPTLPWEVRGGPPSVAEGPQVLVRGDRVFVVYSASGSWTDSYCLGLLSARVDADLLAPLSWTKHAGPIFASANGVFGPGHCSFVRSPDGQEDWIVYHTARRKGSGWSRLVRTQRFEWDADGTPRLGEPAPPDRPIALPGGEPSRIRVEAESAELSGLAKAVPHPSCSGGAKVVGLGAQGGSATFTVTPACAGPHVLVIRSGGEGRATLQLVVNDGAVKVVNCQDNGVDRWTNAFARVDLEPGANRIRLAKGEGSAEVDCLDLIPGP